VSEIPGAPSAAEPAERPRPAPAQPQAASARPRVLMRYHSGSAAGEEQASQIAHLLMFSDFAFGESRAVSAPPWPPVVRYYHPEDAEAAKRLAERLRGTGTSYQVQDMSSFRPPPPLGTLEVWVGG
jgi:hypothetical protein